MAAVMSALHPKKKGKGGTGVTPAVKVGSKRSSVHQELETDDGKKKRRRRSNRPGAAALGVLSGNGQVLLQPREVGGSEQAASGGGETGEGDLENDPVPVAPTGSNQNAIGFTPGGGVTPVLALGTERQDPRERAGSNDSDAPCCGRHRWCTIL